MAIRFNPTELPPCIYCVHATTKDVTTDSAPANERWYQCPHCHRRFAVKALPTRPPKKH